MIDLGLCKHTQNFYLINFSFKICDQLRKISASAKSTIVAWTPLERLTTLSTRTSWTRVVNNYVDTEKVGKTNVDIIFKNYLACGGPRNTQQYVFFYISYYTWRDSFAGLLMTATYVVPSVDNSLKPHNTNDVDEKWRHLPHEKWRHLPHEKWRHLSHIKKLGGFLFVSKVGIQIID